MNCKNCGHAVVVVDGVCFHVGDYANDMCHIDGCVCSEAETSLEDGY